MSLPKLTFTKKTKLVAHILLFAMVISSGTLFAQVQPKATDAPATTNQNQSEYSPTNAPKTPTVQTVDNNQNTVLPKTPDANILPTPSKENTADINPPTKSPEVKQTLIPLILGGIAASAVVGYMIHKFSDCGGNVFCYINGAFETGERFLLGQISECGDMDTQSGYGACQQKYAILLKGGTLADVKNPGALFIAAGVADSALKMPVPINTGEYLATINPLNASTANAQAVDELNTSGLVNLWKNVRNASFAFSALVLVIIGFMIMFRTKLDPRTSITAMNSLPKIIFAMILIYFSFALSGFMLDMGRLALQVVYRTIPFSGGGLGSGLLELLPVILLGFAASFLAGGPAGSVVFTVGLLLILLILAIFLLVVVLNLIYQMLRRYMQFIVYTIFSPLFFLWGAMPGQSSFGWFKSQLANILTIPAMLLIIRLAAYIGFNSTGRLLNSNGVNLPSPFAFGGGSTSGAFADVFWLIISPLVALVLLFYATKMPAIVDGILQIKDYGARAGFGPMAVITAPMGAAASAGKSLSSIQSGAGTLGKVGGWLRNQGYASRPAPIPTPVGTMRTPAAPDKPGIRAAISRTIARGPLRPFGGSDKPWQHQEEWLGDYQARQEQERLKGPGTPPAAKPKKTVPPINP